jgi:N-acetyl-gamma-glutamyl-phosphate reductase
VAYSSQKSGGRTNRLAHEDLQAASVDDVRQFFAEHYVPSNASLLIAGDFDPVATEAQVRAAFESAYAGRPFVRVLKAGRWPSIAAVERTNHCDIGFMLESTELGTHLIVESAIDNLVKGAAGQAVQCMNIRFGFEETAGLLAARVAVTAGGAS